MPNDHKKTIIGRLEKIDIPTFNISGIEAKIDTGAYSGSIHVSSIEEFLKDGKSYIRFHVLDESHPEFKKNEYITDDFGRKKIRSSTGHEEYRYVVPVKINIKDIDINIKITLSDRKDMRHPVLLGRKVIKKYFLIDPSKKYLIQKL